MHIHGKVYLEYTLGNKILLRAAGRNLVVAAGKTLVATIFNSNNGLPVTPKYMMLGAGATTPADTDTALSGAELARVLATLTQAGNELTWAAVFSNTTGGSWAVNEAAIISAPLGGALFARWLTPYFVVDVGGSVNITWKIAFGTTPI